MLREGRLTSHEWYEIHNGLYGFLWERNHDFVWERNIEQSTYWLSLWELCSNTVTISSLLFVLNVYTVTPTTWICFLFKAKKTTILKKTLVLEVQVKVERACIWVNICYNKDLYTPAANENLVQVLGIVWIYQMSSVQNLWFVVLYKELYCPLVTSCYCIWGRGLQ